MCVQAKTGTLLAVKGDWADDFVHFLHHILRGGSALAWHLYLIALRCKVIAVRR